MDDIILGAPDRSQLDLLTTECLSILTHHNFKVDPEKVQRIPLLKSLDPYSSWIQCPRSDPN